MRIIAFFPPGTPQDKGKSIFGSISSTVASIIKRTNVTKFKQALYFSTLPGVVEFN